MPKRQAGIVPFNKDQVSFSYNKDDYTVEVRNYAVFVSNENTGFELKIISMGSNTFNYALKHKPKNFLLNGSLVKFGKWYIKKGKRIREKSQRRK